jgi:hypothetical protein
MLVSREDLSALLGTGSVIKTVQQQSNARAIACVFKHDPNGILNVFLLFVRCKEIEMEKGKRAKAVETAGGTRFAP